ncbi:MAG: hypothetical protein HY073_03595 [Deltaproteobacteria bacterium]|nr:hypothetical protein [Deltaproteobacteria bacterium]
MVDATLSAVDKILEEAERLSRPLPTAEDLQYVRHKNAGPSLPPLELLKQATDLAILKTRNAPGSSKTIGQAIAVIGAGEMGHQLAYDYARAGYEVCLSDVNLEVAGKGVQRILDTLYDSIGRGLYTAEEGAAILARIHPVNTIQEAVVTIQGEGRHFEMIVEAATEKVEVKLKIFAGLRQVVDGRTILATNSSSITAEQAGADAVFHYFNPVHAMALIDGNFADGLPQEKRDRLAQVAVTTRKAYYPVEKDVPGSLVNPIFAATYFAGSVLPDLEETIRKLATAKLSSDDVSVDRAAVSKILDNPRPYAVALLEALYVEATRSEPEDLVSLLDRDFSPSQIGREIRRRGGGQGLFRLIDATGGPRTAVECADNVARYYGDNYRAPEILRQQSHPSNASGIPPRILGSRHPACGDDA